MTNPSNNSQVDRTNSMGLWTYANEYLCAAKIVVKSGNKELPSAPAYYLVCHSIELILKAFLRGKGETLVELRKIGHNLDKTFETAITNNLDSYYSFTSNQRKAISLINYNYSKKELEYITTGFKTLPEYDVLEKIASDLLMSLKNYCLENRHIHDKII